MQSNTDAKAKLHTHIPERLKYSLIAFNLVIYSTPLFAVCPFFSFYLTNENILIFFLPTKPGNGAYFPLSYGILQIQLSQQELHAGVYKYNSSNVFLFHISKSLRSKSGVSGRYAPVIRVPQLKCCQNSSTSKVSGVYIYTRIYIYKHIFNLPTRI